MLLLFFRRLEEAVVMVEPQAASPPVTSAPTAIVIPNVSKAVTPRVVFTGLNPGAVRRLAEVSSIQFIQHYVLRSL